MDFNKTEYQAELFANRLKKNLKLLRKSSRKNGISCFRLYDKDIPEVPLACDFYTFLPTGIETNEEATLFWKEKNLSISNNDEKALTFIAEERNSSYLHMYLYERPYEKEESKEAEWLETMALFASRVLEIKRDNVIIKTRKKFDGDEKGRSSQYEKLKSERSVKGLVYEQGQVFTVNLTEYIDSGLFFDHRPLRKAIREGASGKRVLNLFCYTGSFSVYAAAGNASFVESVDTSNTYLDWAKKNFTDNQLFDNKKYIFTRKDVREFLKEKKTEGQSMYDIIILDPPTFSNSKRSTFDLDINRDWSNLVSDCLSLLSRDGLLYFSSNSRRLKFDLALLPANCSAKDITESTIPNDFRNKKIHRCWKIWQI